MLNFLRRNSQSVVIQSVIVIIAIVFVFWGGSSALKDNTNTLAVVNGKEILYRDFQQQYERTVESYKQQFGGQIPQGFLENTGLKEQVLEQLIQSELLLQGAEKMGILISKETVQRAIQELPAFKNDGRFELSTYKATLERNRLSPVIFETGIYNELLMNRIFDVVGNFSLTPARELQAWLEYFDTEIKLGYAVFKSEDFLSQVKVDEDGLAAWYINNKQKYKTEPQCTLHYIGFKQSDDLKPGAGNSAADQQAAKAAAFKKASAAYEGIIKAGSMTKYSSLPGAFPVKQTAFFARSAPPKEEMLGDTALLQAAFSLRKGELSSIVETASGYAILFIDDVKESLVPELTAVRTQAITDYKKDKAVELARSKAEETLQLARQQQSWPVGVQHKESDYMQRIGTSAQVPDVVRQDAFVRLGTDIFPEKVFTVGTTFYFYQMLDTRQRKEALEAKQVQTLEQQVQKGGKSVLMTDWLGQLRKEARVWTNGHMLR